MPLFLEPEQRFPIVLDCDIDKPSESRPTFYARSLSMRQQTNLSSEIDAIFDDAKTTDTICDRTVAVINKYVIDWRNMGSFEYGSDIRDFLTQQEAMELLRKILANQHVQPEEKKS
jgi:hypothetical protein